MSRTGFASRLPQLQDGGLYLRYSNALFMTIVGGPRRDELTIPYARVVAIIQS